MASQRENHYDNISMHFKAIFPGCMNGLLEMKICNIFLIYGPNVESVAS